MEKLLNTQLENSQAIKDIIRRIDLNVELANGDSVDTLLAYLPCKEGVCHHLDLFHEIKQSIMINFVFSCSEIESKLAIGNEEAAEELFEKAIRKVSKHTIKGELGELLIFTLLDVYFEAPKLLSKISLKTSRRVAVFGADAVHGQYVDGELRLYLGESKLHKSFSGAVSKATKSIKSSLDKYEDEFDLIDSYIDFPEMNEEIRGDLINLLDPFSDTNNSIPERLHTPCFIGFVDPKIFSNDEDTYLEKYKELALKYIGVFYSELEKEGNSIQKTALMLLPFTSLDDLVNEFIEYMGVKE